MKQDITCVFEAVSGVGGIYISNIKAAQNLNLLKTLSIKAIVSVVRNGRVSHNQSEINYHLYIPADDIETYNISQHFEQTYNFIEKTRKKTNILVHCHAGISRSATIVIAYLLKKYNYSLDKIISMIKRRRNIINPNRGFIQQLKKQASKIGISQKQGQKDQDLIKSALKSEKQTSRLFSYSAQKLLKQKLSPQTKRMISSHKKTVKFQQPTEIKISFNQQEDLSDLNQEKNTNKQRQINRKKNDFYSQINQIKVKSDLLHSTIHAFASKESKSLLSNQSSCMIRSKTFSHEQHTLLPQKLDRIQKLRSKILQSQSRKVSKGKMSQSQIICLVNYSQIFGQVKIEKNKLKTLQNEKEVDRKLSNDGTSTTDSMIIQSNKCQDMENSAKGSVAYTQIGSSYNHKKLI